MRVCIVYDTKRGSTKQIVDWMVEELAGHGTRVFRVDDVGSLRDCDLIIVGAPVYFEAPLGSVLRFLEENSERLRDKVFAVFIVCTVPRSLYGYARLKYLKPMLNRIKGKIIDTLIVRGWFKNPPESSRREVKDWVRDLIARLEEKG